MQNQGKDEQYQIYIVLRVGKVKLIWFFNFLASYFLSKK